ncbi:Mutant cadherin, partial [Operophtera brumata]
MTCNIDQVLPANDQLGIADDNHTEVRSHFIRDNTPVLADEIELLRSDMVLLREIQLTLNTDLLVLDDFYTELSPEAGADGAQLTIYVLGALAALLAFLCLVLLVTFIIRTRTLNRRLEALSMTKYGSLSSGLNRAGLAAPGTNKHAVEGSNPIWNEVLKAPDFDAISDASNDSDLIGIEDLPHFLPERGRHWCRLCRSFRKLCQVSERHPLTYHHLYSYPAVMAEQQRQLFEGRCCLIHPFSLFSLAWKSFMVVVNLAHMVLSTFRLFFIIDPHYHQNVHFCDQGLVILNSLCWLDLGINFNMGYLEKGPEGSTIILDRQLIICDYLRTWFACDLVSTLPIGYILLTCHPFVRNPDLIITPRPVQTTTALHESYPQARHRLPGRYEHATCKLHPSYVEARSNYTRASHRLRGRYEHVTCKLHPSYVEPTSNYTRATHRLRGRYEHITY